ncbi:Pol protein [Phytophthora palmivora]|uniref:Pol protein n=1 Tax=Phytophthora palmivora TaxID=4796 RepID=A0A2P4Y9H6_9STRA|nr:Pol protein [Phytophthora palmivora]
MDRGEFSRLTDAQFESVRKMVGIFGGDALRSLAAATPAEQVERIEAFDTYERGLIAHVQGLEAPVAELKPAQPKPLATDHETKAHYQACGIATGATPNAESRRAVWASTVAVPDSTDQAGNIGPQTAEAVEEDADGVSCVAGNIGPQAAEAAGEAAESAFGVGNIVPRRVEETEKNESAACASGVGNEVPRGVKKTSTRAEVDNKAPHSESETPPARPVEEQYHVFDGVSGRQVKAGAVQLEALPEVSALLNLEELSLKDFLAELKAGEIAEMVLLKPETSPEDLNPSSVIEEDVLEGFTKQRATRLGSEILKNPEDPVYPLVKEYSDVVSKHPPSQLPPDRGVRHEIDLVPGTKYCVTRQWPLPREQCEVIDAFFAEKVKSGMVRESKSPHSTPTFCVRKPNRKWRRVYAYNNATVLAQIPILRKDVLLNNILGCTLYSVLGLVDGYYQIVMRESDIPLTAKGADWVWGQQHQDAFNSIKASLQQVPVLDDGGRERVISFQSRQLKAAERNYPVHDKELLAMKYALVKFRVYLLGTRPFVIYTDHASLRTATNSPHLSQRMARWLSFFAEYNFRVEYKPGKLNVLADALSRRPDYELAHLSRVTTDLYDRIRLAYQVDEIYAQLVQFLSGGKDAKVDRLTP